MEVVRVAGPTKVEVDALLPEKPEEEELRGNKLYA